MEALNDPMVRRPLDAENHAENAKRNESSIPMAAKSGMQKDSSSSDDVKELAVAMEDLSLENEKMKKEWKQEMSDMDKMFEEHAVAKLKNLDPYEMPMDLLRGIKLLPHQVQGVRWMIQVEKSNDPPPFWVPAGLNNSKWRCTVPGFKWRTSSPKPIRGGVLADGKSRVILCVDLIPQTRQWLTTSLHRHGFGKNGSDYDSHGRKSSSSG